MLRSALFLRLHWRNVLFCVLATLRIFYYFALMSSHLRWKWFCQVSDFLFFSGGYFDLEPSIDLKDPREDLKNLMRSHSKTKINVSEENTGIPPLIQAITRSFFNAILLCSYFFSLSFLLLLYFFVSCPKQVDHRV